MIEPDWEHEQMQTILLVDDSENDRLLMRRAFKKAEYDVLLREVHNGEEAIAYLKGDAPYGDRAKFPLPILMLLDLNMPKKNGYDVLAWVRTQPRIRRVSITVLSASMRTEDVDQAYDLGANSFLVKPSNIDELIAMVRCLRDWIRINHFALLDAT